MKTIRSYRSSSGYAALPIVLSIGIMSMSMLTYIYQKSLLSHRQQVTSQVKVDYSQKEDAVLRALVGTIPNKAIRAMKSGSSSSASNYSWETIFAQAVAEANAETSVDTAMFATLGDSSIIVANTGDAAITIDNDLVAPIVGSGTVVNAGNTRNTTMLFHSHFGSLLPAPLYSSNTNKNRDETFPLIGFQKRYVNSWRKDVALDANTHKYFNLIPYPNVRFGYARPGDNFIAKRNWWAFSLTFGRNNAPSGVPPVTKNYLLSIYEIPTQLPLSAGNFMSVGQHADGSAWSNVTVQGGLFANSLETQGNFNLTNGLVSGRKSVSLSDGTQVNGATLNSNIDALGAREAFQTTTDADFYEMSLAGNSGRVAIVPLNTGENFLRWSTSESGVLSPQKFSRYTDGSVRCSMRLRVMEMADVANGDHTPTWVRFYYRRFGTQYTDYKRSDGTWPTPGQTGGDLIPFQTEVLPIGRTSLTVYPERFPAHLASLAAQDVTVNHSLYVWPDGNRSDVQGASIPSAADDLVVTLREGEDLSAYTKGFSLVTDCRLYFADSFNQVSIPIPANSGLPAGFEFFPPTSLFSPETRYGIHSTFDRAVDFDGQISSLRTDESGAFRPLDYVGGNDVAVAANKINADLSALISPAQLPPISIMNWMVTVEEID